jgi:hypothetical protein
LNSPNEPQPTERQKRVTLGWLTPAQLRQIADRHARRGVIVDGYRGRHAALGRGQVPLDSLDTRHEVDRGN